MKLVLFTISVAALAVSADSIAMRRAAPVRAARAAMPRFKTHGTRHIKQEAPSKVLITKELVQERDALIPVRNFEAKRNALAKEIENFDEKAIQFNAIQRIREIVAEASYKHRTPSQFDCFNSKETDWSMPSKPALRMKNGLKLTLVNGKPLLLYTLWGDVDLAQGSQVLLDTERSQWVAQDLLSGIQTEVEGERFFGGTTFKDYKVLSIDEIQLPAPVKDETYYSWEEREAKQKQQEQLQNEWKKFEEYRKEKTAMQALKAAVKSQKQSNAKPKC